MPFEPYSGEAAWLAAVRALVPTLAAVFGPDVVVSQHGADTHAWDPLANLRVTTTAMAEAARVVDAVAHRWAGGRWLATGGGGYEVYRVVPRAWALTWLAAAHREPPERTPAAWHDRWLAEASSFGGAGFGLPLSFLDEPNAGEAAGASQRAAEERSLAMLARVRAVTLPRLVREAEDRAWWAPGLAWAGQQLLAGSAPGVGVPAGVPARHRFTTPRPPVRTVTAADLDGLDLARRVVAPFDPGDALALLRSAALDGARVVVAVSGIDDRRRRRRRPVGQRAGRRVAPGPRRRPGAARRRAGSGRCSGRSSLVGRHGRRWRLVSAWRSAMRSSRRTWICGSRSPAACSGRASRPAPPRRTLSGMTPGPWSRGCRAPDRGGSR